jgi:hypothetical protein
MHSTDFERLNTKARAIEEALSRLGQFRGRDLP